MLARRVERATAGSLGIDTAAAVLTAPKCTALKNANVRFAIRYLGSLTSEEVDVILASGLALMPVTFACLWDGPSAVWQLQKCAIPKGTTVWLDLESAHVPPDRIITACNMWARAVRDAGFDPGLYVGAESMLTAEELFSLVQDRYWHSCSKILDRNGVPNEPPCGCCMRQLRPPNVIVGGVLVDLDVIEWDYLGRLPSWCVAA